MEDAHEKAHRKKKKKKRDVGLTFDNAADEPPPSPDSEDPVKAFEKASKKTTAAKYMVKKKNMTANANFQTKMDRVQESLGLKTEADFRRVFEEADADGQGDIDLFELRALLQRTGQQSGTYG